MILVLITIACFLFLDRGQGAWPIIVLPLLAAWILYGLIGSWGVL